MQKSSVARAGGIVVVIAAAAAALILLPVKEYLATFLEWVGGLGDAGLVILAAAYTPACLLFLPAWPLTLGSGFAFGIVRGTIAVSAGSVVAAAAAFLVSRFLARGFIEERIACNPKFRAIDQAVAAHGFKIVLLTRLSPVFPFNLLNYAFGLTQVRFRDYLLASWIGMLPGTLMYVYLGSAVKNLADLTMGKIEGGPWQKVLFFAGLAATVAVTVLVTRVAKRALDQAIQTSEDQQARSQATGEVA